MPALTKRQLAAKKAWATRRARQQRTKRQLAAKKAWVTRRARQAQHLSVVSLEQIEQKITKQEEDFIRVVWKGPAAEFVNLQGDLVVLESRPNIRRVKSLYSDWSSKGAFLAFPYMQFFVHDNITYNKKSGNGTIHNNGLLHISFSNSPLTEDFTIDDVWFPPIPNIYDDHGVCLATDNVLIKNRGDKPSEKFAREIVHLWWSSPFAYDTEWPSHILIKDTSLRSHKNWAKLTQKMRESGDLTPITNVNWPNKINVTTILSRLKGITNITKGNK